MSFKCSHFCVLSWSRLILLIQNQLNSLDFFYWNELLFAVVVTVIVLNELHHRNSTANVNALFLGVSCVWSPTPDCGISHGHWKASAARCWENGERRWRWRWEGPDMTDVSDCVEEYRLCCQPSVSLMKIGMQVSCHSFSMSVHGSRASALQRPFSPFPPLHYKRQDIIHTVRQPARPEWGRER